MPSVTISADLFISPLKTRAPDSNERRCLWLQPRRERMNSPPESCAGRAIRYSIAPPCSSTETSSHRDENPTGLRIDHLSARPRRRVEGSWERPSPNPVAEIRDRRVVLVRRSPHL